MTDTTSLTAARSTIRTVRFHGYGEPAEVLHLEEAPVPGPGANRIRVVVHACGLNPADWAKVPPGLDMNLAAALPMAAIIGHHALDAIGVKSGQTLLIHGGGSWREAMEISMSGKASGKLLLLPTTPAT